MAVTIYEVAKKAGVGIGTVSRVLNDSPQISPATRTKVLRVIKELNFQPHALAQSLARQKTHTIGVIVPFFTGYFYVELLRGIQRALSLHKFDLILYGVDDLQKKDASLKRALQQRRVDGVLLVSMRLSDNFVSEFKRRRLPLVLVDAFHDQFDSITVNNQEGAYSATRHLIRLGYHHIAMLTGHFESIPAQTRLDGCQRALKEAGMTLPEDMLITSDSLPGEAARVNDGFNQEAGYLAMRNFLATRPRNGSPTAVFVNCDIQAIGVIKAVKESGLRIPEDIALIGFDDIELAEYVGLTTVRQPMSEMGQKAVERMMALLEHPDLPRQHLRLETQLVVRESCGATKLRPGLASGGSQLN
ncbi:MAG: LacI family DNA-binding transcriptional regulator [bacterium]